ncbi:TrkH family potassium uptake protein [Garciella nitratireducens]|uniref:TrkH family potassium uptake protein n=1 Tax=Garciella nitratireducens TaxID=218205 RepID=UPI000E04F6BD|nr:TrkH family potassium uptake protein [Garciella nitratireducens]RBP46647.1 trk system potassium uptake protein TrkH [Garciella nitratireducens]
MKKTDLLNFNIFNSIKILNLQPQQILVIGFLIIIFIGGFLLNLPISSKDGESIGLLNALFTATSAVCVTGLVVVDTATHWTIFGKVVIILLIQIGGLGFMTMTTLFFLIMKKKITIKERLILQESLNQNTLSGIVRFSKHILIFTFLTEGIGAVTLSFYFIPEFGITKGIGMSIFHSISAFCNAGFDLIGNFRSLTPFVGGCIINFTIMGLIVIGGLGFSVVLDMMEHKKLKRMGTHSKLVLLITTILILLGAFTLYILERGNPATIKNLPLKSRVLACFFQSVSPRTAGFNTLDLSQLRISSKFLIIILMFIGGSPGSTAGGIKTTTIGVLMVTVVSVLQGKEDIEIFKRRVAFNVIRKALSIIMISFFLVVIITMLLSSTEEASFMEILFETVSAFGTVGLSLGITSSLSTIGKIIIMITMFIGRLGPLTIGYAIVKRQGKKGKRNYRYPKGHIMVG